MDKSKRNHYLPQFYLEAFGVGGKPPKFWVYDKNASQPKLQTPINTGLENNLYNLENPGEPIDDSIEREVLSKIDNASVEAIRRLLPTGGRLRTNEGDLLGFLAIMATRVPRNIQAIKEIGSASASNWLIQLSKKPTKCEEIVNELKAQGKLSKDLSLQTIQKSLSETDERVNIKMDPKVAMAMSLLLTGSILKELLQMNCCLFRAPSGIEFITGDAPMVCFVLEPNGKAMLGAGYGLPNAEVTFPLSPNRCLYLDYKNNQHYRAVSKKMVMEINQRTAWTAERFIISRCKSKYVAELTECASKTLNYPKVNKKELYHQFERNNYF